MKMVKGVVIVLTVAIGLMGLYKAYIFYKAGQLFEYSSTPPQSTYRTLTNYPLSKSEVKMESLEEFSLQNLNFTIPKLDTILYDSLFARRARIVVFKDTTSIMLTYDSHIEGLDFINLIQEIDEYTSKSTFTHYFNKYGISSNYELLKYAYNFTADDILYFDSNQNIQVGYSLLKLKYMTMAVGYKDYFNCFETPYVKGFQFGTPLRSKKIIVNCFDHKDEQYSLLFQGKGTSQEMIDYILKCIRPNHNSG